MNKKILVLGVVIVFLITIACVPKIPQEKIDAQLHNLSDQDLNLILQQTNKSNSQAVAGQAYKLPQLKAPTQQVYERALIERNKRLQTVTAAESLPANSNVAMANPKFQKLKTLPLNWWDGAVSGFTAKDLMNKKDGQMKGKMLIDANGKVGSAFSFDGIDDYVEISHFNNDNPLLGMTVDAWIKPAGFDQSKSYSSQAVFTQEGNLHWTLKLSPENIVGGASLYFTFDDGVSSAGFKTVPIVALGKWNHVAVTFQHGLGFGTPKVKMFVNGVEVQIAKSGALKPAPQSSQITLYFGKPSQVGDSFTEPFHGLLDEVRIFNVVMTPTEIKELYTISTP